MVGLDNPLHLAILLAILLLIFGAKRLPELGRSLGAGMRGFKESITGESRQPATQLTAAAGDQTAEETPERVGGRPAA
jgi:sec-independent protein translocase protein TatA